MISSYWEQNEDEFMKLKKKELKLIDNYLGFGLFLIDFCPYFLHLYPSSPIPLLPKHLIFRVYLFSILLINPLSTTETLKKK